MSVSSSSQWRIRQNESVDQFCDSGEARGEENRVGNDPIIGLSCSDDGDRPAPAISKWHLKPSKPVRNVCIMAGLVVELHAFKDSRS